MRVLELCIGNMLISFFDSTHQVSPSPQFTRKSIYGGKTLESKKEGVKER
jgi:hypothetical protein